MWRRRLVLVLVLVGLCGGVDGAQRPRRGGPLVGLELPERLTVESGRSLHAEMLRRADRERVKRGRLVRRAHRRDGGAGFAWKETLGLGHGGVFSPLDFGGDPSGTQDSTQAVLKALAAALAMCHNSKPYSLAAKIWDCGGAAVDLAGGEYQVSAPLVIPKQRGNLAVRGGTLRASIHFPTNRSLIEAGKDDCRTDSQGSCNEFLVFEDLMLHAAHRAAGGLRISHTMGAVVARCFFYGFEEFGLHIELGHEVMLSESWFAQYFWNEKPGKGWHGIGVRVHGNDHYLHNVIVFDHTDVGVKVESPIAVLEGVHTWNGGSAGIWVLPNCATTRIISCYLDYNPLVLEDPVDVIVEQTFFLETYAVIRTSGSIQDLRFESNSFAGAGVGTAVRLKGNLEHADNVKLVDNRGTPLTTASWEKKVVHNCTQAEIELPDLLFPWIAHFSVTIESASPVLYTARSQPNSRKIVVVFAKRSSATIHIFATN